MDYFNKHHFFFEKYNVYTLTSRMKRKNKKIDLFYLPLTITLDLKNNNFLEKNSKLFFNYSRIIEAASCSEIDALKFSDSIFFLKVEPKKYLLGNINSSTYTTNSFFFFI
jgi:hypothetical protein